MSLPSLDKTYQYNVNQSVAASGATLTTNRRVMRAIKDGMKGFGTLPWTTRYSCDSSVAGSAGDGVDRWTTDGSLVWANAGSAHSWYVLRNTGIATNFELLLSLEGASASGTALTLVISPAAAFTGGTTTARPTATDEIIIINNTVWGGQASDSTFRIHQWHSTDAQVSQTIVYVSNLPILFWRFEKPKNPVTGWTNPSVSWAKGTSGASSQITTSLLFSAAAGNAKGASAMALFMTGEGYNNTLLSSNQVSANDLSAEFPLLPVGLASTTAANRGRHGQSFDLWWGLDSNGQGDTYPNDTSRQFVQMGSLVFPWNGTVVSTA